MTPAKSVKAAERRKLFVVDGSVERFEGFALLALPLSSGYVLALRRCTTSSIGPPYTSVWQRDPLGRWTFLVDVMPERACPRYYGPALHDVRVGTIDVVWKSRYELAVYAHAARLHLALRLSASAATRLASTLLRAVPRPLWQHDASLDVIGQAAGAALQVERLMLRGRAPAGHHFRIQPRALWRVEAAVVTADGKDLGGIDTLRQPVALRDYVLPRTALFAVGAMDYRAPAQLSNGTPILVADAHGG